MTAEEKQTIDILVPLSGKGGVENVINRTAGYLLKQGYRVRVVQMVFNGPLWLDGGIAFYPLRREKVKNISDFPEMYAQFLAQTYVPDLVLATPWPYLTLTAKKALAQVGGRFTKIVAWLHAPLEILKKYEVGGAECLGFADKIFVLNERSRALLETLLPQPLTEVVCNPVDFGSCPAISPEGRRLALFVGRLSEEKGVSVIIDAVKKCRSGWSLKIIGDGALRDALEQQARSLGIAERVEFLGWREQPWECAQGADALVMASDYEAFPLTAIEAMACGLPVFSTPVDGMTELIKPGENGFLYEKGDSGELAGLLDLYAEGRMPRIDAEACRRFVSAYEAGAALLDFERKLKAAFDKLSVIIPCYNVEKLLPRCLESVFGQRLGGVELEVVCVDDKSTDRTLDVLMEWEARYPQQMLVLPLEQNGKQGRARNLALQYASGNYISYVDADDALEPECLRRLYELILENGCEAAGCGYRMTWEQQSRDVPIIDENVVFDFENSVFDLQRYLMCCGWKTSPWGRIYQTELLRKNEIRFAEGIFMEDILFSNRCLKYMKKYAHIPDALYIYYYNPNGTMASGRIREYYLDTAVVMNRSADELLGCGRFEDCMKELAYVYFSKAFTEPMSRMWEDSSFFSYEAYCDLKENVRRRFPAIEQNPYLNTTQDEGMRTAFLFYKRDVPSEEALWEIMGYDKRKQKVR